MDFLVLGSIEFTMLYLRAGTHALHTARADDRTGTHAILVRERSFQHITDDLHITVAMGAKTAAGLDGIIIDDAQCSELDVFGIMIIRERKTVAGIQSAVIGMAPLPGIA